MYFQKKKRFHRLWRLHMLYNPISSPSKYIFLLPQILSEKIMKNICQCLLNLLKFMTFRNGKAQDKKFESFYNKHLKFLPKYFAENGKEKLFPNSSSFVSNLTNVKMNTRHSRFNKSLQTYLLARSNVLHFSTKKESVIIMTMTNF